MTASTIQQSVPLFPLGRLLATPGAMAQFDLHDEIHSCFVRHVCGNWGDVCDEDKAANDAAIINGERIISAYDLPSGRLWIITEADRSATTALLPEEY